MSVADLTSLLPRRMARKVEPVLETVAMVRQMRASGPVVGMLPSVARGAILRQGRHETQTAMISGHEALFDWTYESTNPEMRQLYSRAKQNQWDAETDIDWSRDVDPMNPDVPLLPHDFVDLDLLPRPPRLSAKERRELNHSLVSWMLSQFLHGEQGALFAAAQVTESVRWMDGKLYGATQVMDEARHVEAMHRYLTEKLGKMYVINDNLFVIIDALMADSRWDMKFLGMQIMVEGLALGAFGTLYQVTSEPLLREMLAMVIQDEARHVHFGVLALREHILNTLTPAERREREDWVYEVSLLMRNRFLAHEVYEEWFEGSFSRADWNEMMNRSPGMRRFRTVMFSRLVPNLRSIGLLSDRMKPHYEAVGLMQFADGADATTLDESDLLQGLAA